MITSTELIYLLIGNVTFATNESKLGDNNNNNISDVSLNNTETEYFNHNTNDDINNNSNAGGSTAAFESRINDIFGQMDENQRGLVDYNDFKRVILNDSEIIQGFLLYDGVI